VKAKALILLILAVVLMLRTAARVAVAFSVSTPHTSKLKTIELAFRSPYQIASPHMNLWQDIRSRMFPTVYAQACFVGNCAAGFKPKATCNPSCSSGCNCPDCTAGPCTIFKCSPSVTLSGCTAGSNPSPMCALSCADDNSCTP
jgi:hypothetical protein